LKESLSSDSNYQSYGQKLQGGPLIMPQCAEVHRYWTFTIHMQADS